MTWYRAAAVALLATASACRSGPAPYDLDFQIPRSETFAPVLADYHLYEQPGSLVPADGVLPYELSSELFSDYASKQRLMKIPEGSVIRSTGETLEFPEGTLLAKTFFYPTDMRSTDSPKRILETRLLVKVDGLWNVATYVWNASQSEATLLLDGATTTVTWTDSDGASQTVDYGIPHEGECVTCHQSNDSAVYIGPSLANLDRTVTRSGEEIGQLDFLTSAGVLEAQGMSSPASIPDYRDERASLEDRARAYLDINCAHCHNPDGWDEATERQLDFRFTTPLTESGIDRKADELPELLQDGTMPYLGTTLPHREGIQLLSDFAATIEAPAR